MEALYAIESNSKNTRFAKADNGIEKKTHFPKTAREFGKKKSEIGKGKPGTKT
jgi:hypothetical protein